MSATELIQQALNGLSLGSTYALLALGLALVFSIMRLVNFAHGDLLTIGGYTMWFLTDHGMPWLVVCIVTLAVTTVAAVLMERLAFRPLRGASMVTLLITSFAVGFFIQNMFGILISPRAQGIEVPGWLGEALHIGNLTVSLLQVLTTVTTGVALALLLLVMTRSRTGIAMRAAADDFKVARLVGVKANRVIVGAFALSGLLAGIAAILYISRSGSVEPTTGLVPVIKAFIAVVIGGLGSLPGAVVGGFILGFSEIALQATLPEAALPFRDAFTLLIVILILLWRPQGLFGKRTEIQE